MTDALRAAREWVFRGQAERDATRRYAQLAERLAKSQLDIRLAALAAKASKDEADHAARCDMVVRTLGFREQSKATSAGILSFAPAALSDDSQALLYEVVAIGAINETINAALLVSAMRETTHPMIRETVRVLATDEVDHAQLGWACVTAAARAGNATFLGEWLPAMLDGGVREALFDREVREDDGAPELGCPSGVSRVKLLRDVLQDVVFPGFERAGIDAAAGRAWLESRVAALPTG